MLTAPGRGARKTDGNKQELSTEVGPLFGDGTAPRTSGSQWPRAAEKRPDWSAGCSQTQTCAGRLEIPASKTGEITTMLEG